MSGLLESVGDNVPDSCRATTINKEGCSVSLAGLPRQRLIIDLDKPGSPLSQNETRCDYLLLVEFPGEPGSVSAVELKSGRASPGDVRGQLQGGVDAAARLIPSGYAVDLLPVLASQSDKAGRKRIRATVRFRGKDVPIQRIRCGNRLPIRSGQ